MCISATMLSAISTAVQVAGALTQGAQQSSMYKYQAAQANADAQAEREAAEVRADKIRKAGKYQQSEARAALAASGVETGSGSAVRINQQIGRDTESDALSEILSGQYGAQKLESQAQGYGMAAKNASTSGYLRAGGSLLSGYQRDRWIKSGGSKEWTY